MSKNTIIKPNKPLYRPKNYHLWMKVKARLHNEVVEYAPYREGEVYWFCIGDNIGTEEDGKNEVFSRPVVIVRGFSRTLVWGVPLSHTKNTGPYYHEFEFKGEISNALLSQLRSFDLARATSDCIGVVKRKELSVIRRKLKMLL